MGQTNLEIGKDVYYINIYKKFILHQFDPLRIKLTQIPCNTDPEMEQAPHGTAGIWVNSDLGPITSSL